MPQITLYHFPYACSRVTMNALEETGVPFDTYLVNGMRDEQTTAAYLAINPKGKVPALAIDGRVLTENAAILHHLHTHFPAAKLLPDTDARLGSNQVLQDLFWCSSALHPMTRMIRAPMRFTSGDTAGVVALGKKYYEPVLAQLAERFDAGQWWYGSQWCILDTYLQWNYTTAQSGGLDLSSYPSLARHAEDVARRPSFQRAIARELADLEKSGIQLPFAAKK